MFPVYLVSTFTKEVLDNFILHCQKIQQLNVFQGISIFCDFMQQLTDQL